MCASVCVRIVRKSSAVGVERWPDGESSRPASAVDCGPNCAHRVLEAFLYFFFFFPSAFSLCVSRLLLSGLTSSSSKRSRERDRRRKKEEEEEGKKRGQSEMKNKTQT